MTRGSPEIRPRPRYRVPDLHLEPRAGGHHPRSAEPRCTPCTPHRVHTAALALATWKSALTTPTRPSQESPAFVLDNDLYLLDAVRRWGRRRVARGWRAPTSTSRFQAALAALSSIWTAPYPALIDEAQPGDGLLFPLAR